MTEARLDDVVREVQALRLEMSEMRDTILDRIDTAYVRKEYHTVQMQHINDRVTELARAVGSLEAGRNWLMASVILLALGTFVTFVVGRIG